MAQILVNLPLKQINVQNCIGPIKTFQPGKKLELMCSKLAVLLLPLHQRKRATRVFGPIRATIALLIAYKESGCFPALSQSAHSLACAPPKETSP